MRFFLLYLTILFIYSCVPPIEQNDLDVNIDLTNVTQQNIITAKDRREAGALIPFLNSKDVTERYLATEAASSVQDESLIPLLVSILNSDPSEDIRYLAAFALGQYGNPTLQNDLIAAFQLQDTANYNTLTRGTILEAIGKCGDQQTLDLISEVSTYRSSDHHLLLGQARAIYRYGLRNIYSPKGTKIMIERVTDQRMPQSVRLMAAQYLARNPGLDINNSLDKLSDVLKFEENEDIRIALSGAVASRGQTAQIPVVLNLLSSETDYRVQSNIIRNIGSYDYAIYRDTVIGLLESENDHIFNLSATLLQNNAPRQEAAFFLDKARKATNNQRKAKLYSIALNVLPSRFINTRKIVNDEISVAFRNATIDIEQAAYINALSLDPANLLLIINNGLGSPNHLVRTTSINSLLTLMTNPKTLQIYRRPSTYDALRERVVNELSKLLKSGDPGSISAIANLVRNENCGFKQVVGLNLLIRSAMRKLDLLKDYEARKECLLSLNYLEDTTYVIDLPSFNHPIDWSNLTGLTDSSRAYIITTKGQIEVKLFKNHAPGSVSNFVSLAQSNFFDGKTIHRVVPSFVIQAGCPRGDGYGSLDYTIRSELGPKYYDAEGYVGMASAGKDTEGTQWFITHAPTPHLDGRYTIFGKVTSGMDIVHKIYQGDLIQDVRILKY